jgi:hypothetical protein
MTKEATVDSPEARGPATFRVLMEFFTTQSAKVLAECAFEGERWRKGLWCLAAKSAVLFEPPVRPGLIVKITEPSESTTFRSVRCR